MKNARKIAVALVATATLIATPASAAVRPSATGGATCEKGVFLNARNYDGRHDGEAWLRHGDRMVIMGFEGDLDTRLTIPAGSGTNTYFWGAYDPKTSRWHSGSGTLTC